MIGIVSFVFISAFAAIFDYFKRKIPNYVVAVGLVIGIIRILFFDNACELLKAISLCILIIILLFPFFMTGALGAGDVKLLCLLPFFYKNGDMKQLLIILLVVGLTVSIGKMIYYSNLLERLKFFWLYINKCINVGEILPYNSVMTKDTTISLAIPIAFGALVFIIFKYLSK